MKVLVTGAGGFVGAPTVRLLAQAGYDVHAVSRSGRVPPLPGLTLHRADLLDPAERQRLIAAVRPSHLLHLAWFVEHGEFWTSLENVDWLAASLHLLRLFQSSGGRRWVGAGTYAEYDWSPGGILPEDGPIRPVSLYGSSKASLWMTADSFGQQTGMSMAWGRIFNAYGPGEPAGRLVPSVIRSLLAGQVAECTAGTQVRDFIHVDNIAAAFVRLLETSHTGAFNIGSGTGARVGEVSETIAGLIGRTDLLRLGAVPSRPGEPAFLVASPDRLKSLGLQPPLSLTTGLEQTITWWQNYSVG